jgi:hypothetical protein
MEFSNQMETLEKKAGETAAAVKAAAAASRLHSMTIDADRPIVFHHSLVWLLHTAQVTALRSRHRLPQIDIEDHDESPRSSPRSTTTISPCRRSSSGMD